MKRIKKLFLPLLLSFSMLMLTGCGNMWELPFTSEKEEEKVVESSESSENTTSNSEFSEEELLAMLKEVQSEKEAEVESETTQETEEKRPTITAEELLNNTFDSITYTNSDIELRLVASTDMSDLTDNTSGMSATIDVSLDANLNLECNKNACYMKGSGVMNMLGMTVEIPIEGYSIIDNYKEYAYSYDVDSDSWGTGVGETTKKEVVLFPLHTSDMFESYKLIDTEESYRIEGTLKMDEVFDTTNDVADLGSVVTDYNNLFVDVVIDFDKATLFPYYLEYNLSDSGNSSKSSEIKEFSIIYKATEYNNTGVVNIPKELSDYIESISSSTYTASSTVTNEHNTTAVNTADYKSYQLSVNGNTVTLPCSYKEFSEVTGWEMKSADTKSYLEGNENEYIYLYDDNGNICCQVDIANTTSEDAQYSDCTVYYVVQADYHVENGVEPIQFPCGLYVGLETTAEELIAKLGEPQYKYEDTKDRNWQYYQYTWCEDENYTYSDCIDVTITNGVVADIGLEHSSALN